MTDRKPTATNAVPSQDTDGVLVRHVPGPRLRRRTPVTLLVDAIGWAGAGCLLLAYARLSSGRLAVGLRYHLLNLAGSVGLGCNAAFHRAWPSTAVNVIWLGIGLAALRRTARRGSGRPTAGSRT